MTQRNRRRHRRRGGIRSKIAVGMGGVLLIAALVAVGILSWVLGVAAKAPALATCKPVKHGDNSIVYAADGSKLGIIPSDEAHAPISIKRIPHQLQLATVAIEDQRFFQHGALDVEGIARAAIKDLEAGSAVEGGSTITQQLVRNLCINHPARTLERKVIEAQLATEYAERHSKREILSQYLNSISYGTIRGATAVGVQAASEIYFSKPVWKLNLVQAALLAGIPQAPTANNPLLNPADARERRNEVLGKMAQIGFISHRRAVAAEHRGLELDPGNYFEHRQPYFFDYVEKKLIDRYGARAVRKGGLRVHTTIDSHIQETAEAAMRSTLPYSTDPASALVSINPANGYIEAMASSSNYEQSQFNLAAQGHRQPGSTFKAFVLTAALKQGIDPYSTYYTSKPLNLYLPRWGHWEVHTADLGYLGRVNLREATVASDNTVFAQLDLDVGPKNVAATAKSMGITTPLDGIPAEGIGGLRIGVSPLEMADAYATLAAGGIHRNPIAIRRVDFPNGRSDRPERASPRRVVSEPVAYQVTRLLHDNITEGTGTAAYTGCSGQAGKTGTTDRFTDAWFAGYQPNLSTVVWVGYPQSNEIEMTGVHGITVYGGTFPAEIWHSVYSYGEVPCEEFSTPRAAINWAPFYGRYTSAQPRAQSGNSRQSRAARRMGEEATGGYNPDAYAPGVGQKPTPVPPYKPPPEPGSGGGSSPGGGPPAGAGPPAGVGNGGPGSG